MFRAVMGSVCTPVSVVTAMAGDRPHGTTVSAFASLSLDPPMVLVSLDRSSDLLRLVRRSLAFGLNVLHSGQSALASAFARKGEDKFDGVDWTLDGGVPRLGGSAGWLACRVERLVKGGDHIVVLGRVVAVRHDPAPPLTYYQRGFGTHHPHRAEIPRPPRPPHPTRPAHPAPVDLPAPLPPFAVDSLEEWFAFT
jgi:flavin reductase (DIM6/NTAB) family NADH-FMN oxidoreductase RutF